MNKNIKKRSKEMLEKNIEELDKLIEMLKLAKSIEDYGNVNQISIIIQEISGRIQVNTNALRY